MKRSSILPFAVVAFLVCMLFLSLPRSAKGSDELRVQCEICLRSMY